MASCGRFHWAIHLFPALQASDPIQPLFKITESYYKYINIAFAAKNIL